MVSKRGDETEVLKYLTLLVILFAAAWMDLCTEKISNRLIFFGIGIGLFFQLKEHGAGLSIGQRQLIAFARTMLSMPKVLILDEATSSIDTHTEILVQRGIEALLSGRTSFVIAHRLSTIQNADRIFVIDKGGILEQGSPKELMAKKGAYYNLYMAQFAGLQ